MRVTAGGRILKTWKPDKQWSSQRGLNPTRTVAVSFGVIIALGALLLLLPPMSRSGTSAGFFLSLYTATSAVCVTGSVLADTAAQWSLGGQLVLLLLFQLVHRHHYIFLLYFLFLKLYNCYNYVLHHNISSLFLLLYFLLLP